MITGYKCRCGDIVQIKQIGPSNSKQLKTHLVNKHGYSEQMSFRQEYKLLKNYFTGDPITD